MSRLHHVLGCLVTSSLLTLGVAAPAAAASAYADTDYVALGDSYSSGVGAPGQIGLCLRSPNGYPGAVGQPQPAQVVHRTSPAAAPRPATSSASRCRC